MVDYLQSEIECWQEQRLKQQPEQQSEQQVKQKGFTLLELLVVVSILAAISFTTATVFQGIDEEVDGQLAQVELVEVAKAVKRFRADTGYFPKEGPFDLDADATVTGSSACQTLYTALTGSATGHPAAAVDVDDASLFPAYAPVDCDDKVAWFYNAANLSQLTAVGTVQAGMSAVNGWDAAAAKGWRGPYLDASAEGYVDIGSTDLSLWSPSAGTVWKDVPAVFTGGPERPQGSYYVSRRVPSNNAGYLAGEVTDLEWSGRPVLMFVDKGGDVVAEKVVLVSMGQNGQLDSDIAALQGCSPAGDDQIICIYAD